MGQIKQTRSGQHLPMTWHRVTRGAARTAAKDAEDAWLGDLATIQLVLPADSRWTHLTGARLRGWWLPPVPRGLPLLAAGTTQVRRRGVSHARRAEVRPAQIVKGIRVDPAVDILVACARDLGELDLLCLVVGALVTKDCALSELTAVAERSFRGARALRRVLRRASDLPESIWEVLLAELHRSVGIEVKPQHVVHHPDTGAFVARGDLWLVGTRVLHEYDGAGHRDADQHANDLVRDRRLDRARWRRRGYVSRDLLDDAVHVLSDADEAVGRRHRPERIRPWYALLQDSLFTPRGRHALLRRVIDPPARRHCR